MKLKTQFVMKLKNSNFSESALIPRHGGLDSVILYYDKTPKQKLWNKLKNSIYDKTQIMKKILNPKCHKTQILTKLKNSNKMQKI